MNDQYLSYVPYALNSSHFDQGKAPSAPQGCPQEDPSQKGCCNDPVPPRHAHNGTKGGAAAQGTAQWLEDGVADPIDDRSAGQQNESDQPDRDALVCLTKGVDSGRRGPNLVAPNALQRQPGPPGTPNQRRHQRQSAPHKHVDENKQHPHGQKTIMKRPEKGLHNVVGAGEGNKLYQGSSTQQ